MGAVVERLAALGVSRVSRWCFNCYLLTGDDGAIVVVDPGMPTSVDDVEPLLATMAGQVRVVTATHGHCDHVGGAAALARRHDANVHLPTVTLSYLEGVEPRTPSLVKLARTWPLLFGQPFDRRAATGFVRAAVTAGFGGTRRMLWPGPRPVGSLEDGQPLHGASAWTVVRTPGHTDDSIALWNAETRTLLSGDAVLTINGRPRFAPDTVDVRAAAETASRLRELPVEHLLPGHGLPIHARSVWDLA
ncbi:MBL fold metallo-hydrolase [Nocardia sp. alder85J]|uniref:MBL fold metallo-hydrolase n=1 Tax=Nocardia sp. alder85J TaxID=2862949 RepID=UPI001CD7618A|nr:MBL fold metallo-hydrolase [Nocardia sp. alder85J]MCX4095161.1 MBL fold metallo-hydrolase [Nocardia sp. alder85J]